MNRTIFLLFFEDKYAARPGDFSAFSSLEALLEIYPDAIDYNTSGHDYYGFVYLEVELQ